MRTRVAAILYLGLAVLLLSSTHCGFNRPKVNNSAWFTPQIDHAKFLNSCSPCHVNERPAPVFQTVHGDGKDCATCHVYTAEAKWLSRQQYSHIPNPASCLPCHGSLRPGPPHIQAGDCVSCHLFPTWSPINQ